MTALVLMLAALGDDKEADEALARFKTSYATPSAVARAGAVMELARTQHEKILPRLAGVLGNEAKEVKAAAARGLGGYSDYKKQALGILTASIAPNDKEPDVQAAIYEALGKLNDPAALPALHKGIEDKDAKAAAAAIVAAAAFKNAATIDLILNEFEDADKLNKAAGGGGGVPGVNIPGGGGGADPAKTRAKEVVKACNKAMQLISGDKYTTYGEWKIWWGKRRATFGQQK
ncbi:MAG TPA: HEAT repeat domain-containing protein [Planctomycetota bacterium]